MKGNDRKKILKQKVTESIIAPGILAYIDDQPVGWLAINPRENYQRIQKSRVIKPVDDKPVWCITCFFIDKHHRGKGITKALIKKAEEYAKECGATIIETYPIDFKASKDGKVNVDSAYVGISTFYDEEGYSEVGKTKAKASGLPRIIMRKFL